jgi:hypothetical protein
MQGWVRRSRRARVDAHQLASSDWRIVGTYSGETEARIAPFDEVPLNVADLRPPAAPENQR